jgi:2-oxo-4-hydroxy-4-carboxy-5-ureidoimidazoline decarboxylase
MRLDELNTLPTDEVVTKLLGCCGSTRWSVQMAARRPFANLEAIGAEADKIWHGLAPEDWREAFAAHPRIGARSATPWSLEEQRGVEAAPAGTRARLEDANREYEARFGFIFIVCATGKSAEEMLASANERLKHPPDEEWRIAGEEQRKITRVRLAKLLA